MENGNNTTTVSTKSNPATTSKMSVLMEHLTLALLGFQFFPFITPREWLLIHGIKVVPGIEPHMGDK